MLIKQKMQISTVSFIFIGLNEVMFIAFLHFFAGDVVVPGVQRPLPVLFSAI